MVKTTIDLQKVVREVNMKNIMKTVLFRDKTNQKLILLFKIIILIFVVVVSNIQGATAIRTPLLIAMVVISILPFGFSLCGLLYFLIWLITQKGLSFPIVPVIGNVNWLWIVLPLGFDISDLLITCSISQMENEKAFNYAIMSSLITLLSGFGVMLYFWITIENPVRPGLFDYYLSSFGDAICLPTMVGSLVYYHVKSKEVVKEDKQKNESILYYCFSKLLRISFKNSGKDNIIKGVNYVLNNL